LRWLIKFVVTVDCFFVYSRLLLRSDFPFPLRSFLVARFVFCIALILVVAFIVVVYPGTFVLMFPVTFCSRLLIVTVFVLFVRSFIPPYVVVRSIPFVIRTRYSSLFDSLRFVLAHCCCAVPLFVVRFCVPLVHSVPAVRCYVVVRSGLLLLLLLLLRSFTFVGCLIWLLFTLLPFVIPVGCSLLFDFIPLFFVDLIAYTLVGCCWFVYCVPRFGCYVCYVTFIRSLVRSFVPVVR
jgi:hypothetical protein